MRVLPNSQIAARGFKIMAEREEKGAENEKKNEEETSNGTAPGGRTG